MIFCDFKILTRLFIWLNRCFYHFSFDIFSCCLIFLKLSFKVKQCMLLFIPKLCIILVLIGSFCDNLRDVSWNDAFKFNSSTATEFCQWVWVGRDVHIPHCHCNYRVKPESSPCFSPSCSVAIAHRNHFFCLYQESLQTSDCCKRVIESNTLAYI